MRHAAVLALVAAALLAFAASPAAGATIPERPVTLALAIASLREATVSLQAATDPHTGMLLRAAVDGTGDGTVSAEEYGVFVSTLDYAVTTRNLTTSTAYAYLWARENTSGSSPFSLAGRANVTALVLSLAIPARLNCTLDDVQGTIERAAATFTNLSGAVGRNVSVAEQLDLTVVWPSENASRVEHRFELETPTGAGFVITLAGSFRISGVEHLLEAKVDAGGTTLTGVTGSEVIALEFVVREAATMALALVALSVVAAVGVAGAAIAWSARRHTVADKPLPITPKYK